MTETQTQTRKGFAPTQIGILPTLSNVGYVNNVGKAKVSKSQKYMTMALDLEPVGGNQRKTLYFTFHPEWFSYDFDPTTLEGSSAEFVYKNHINSNDSKALRALYFLGGSEEGYNTLCSHLSEIKPFPSEPTEADVDRYCEEITDVFDRYFSEVRPKIGFCLKQKMEEIGVDEETGKKLYQRTKYYDFSKFFYVTEKNLEKERKTSANREKQIQKLLASDDPEKVKEGRTTRKYICTFDSEVAF